MKSTKELRPLSLGELQARSGEFKKELLKLNVQVASGTGSSNPGRIRLLRKNIARVYTLIKEKDLIKEKELKESGLIREKGAKTAK